MGRLTRPQRKGKKGSYTDRFIKNTISLGNYDFDLEGSKVIDFSRSPKTKATIMVLKSKNNIVKNFVAPLYTKVGEEVNKETSNLKIKALKDFPLGSTICNIEFKQHSYKFLCRAPGTYAKLASLENDKATILIKDRKIILDANLKAMSGSINTSDFWFKPMLKAGTASIINRKKGKKYPKVSSSRMNVLESCLGGSYKKRRGRPMTVSRHAPPGRKVGHIAARRTGLKKK